MSYMPRVVAMDGVCGSLHHPVGPNHGGGGGMSISILPGTIKLVVWGDASFPKLFKKLQTTLNTIHCTW